MVVFVTPFFVGFSVVMGCIEVDGTVKVTVGAFEVPRKRETEQKSVFFVAVSISAYFKL